MPHQEPCPSETDDQRDLNGHVREDDAAMIQLSLRQGAFTQASQLRADVAALIIQRDDLARRLGTTQLRLGVVLNEKGDLEGALALVRRQRDELRRGSSWLEREEWKRLHGEAVAELEAAHERVAELEGQNEALGCDLIKANIRVEELEQRDVVAQLRAELAGALVVADELRIERFSGDVMVRILTEQIEAKRRQLLDQGKTLVHAQAENRAIRSLVDLTRAAFKHHTGDEEVWDSDTPGEMLTVWDQFLEIFERLS